MFYGSRAESFLKLDLGCSTPHKEHMVKILLAEDDDDLRRFLVKALEKAGHRVTPFAEGASAFEEIKQATFDLLLTDIVMPEMDALNWPGARRSLIQRLRSCSSPDLRRLP